MGSLRDREVACSASDRQGSTFESCVWRTVSSQSSHHPQEVLLAQFSLYVHKGGLKPDSFHFISLLQHLHWLPLRERIIFKIMLLTYRGVNGMAPTYIERMLIPYKPQRSLRSSESGQLVVPHSRLKGYGDRAFAVVAPTLWNNLPEHIRRAKTLESFKTLIKTELFVKAFYKQ